MASGSVQVAVFADTSLGTHIAMAISPDILAEEFKREFEREHLNCFPKHGEIIVNRLMVKRKSCFYHLSDSFPIKYAFKGFEGTGFIYIEACVSSSFKNPHFPGCTAEDSGDHISNDGDVTKTLRLENFVSSTNKYKPKCRRKRRILRFHCLKTPLLKVLRAIHLSKEKKRRKREKKFCTLAEGLEKEHLRKIECITDKERFGISPSRNIHDQGEDGNSCSLVENTSESVSKPLSVSGIIKKYFPNYDEVTSGSQVNSATTEKKSSALLEATDDNCSNIENIIPPPQYTTKTSRSSNIKNNRKSQYKAKTPRSSYTKNNRTPQCTAKTPRRMIFSSSRSRSRSLASRDKVKSSEVGKRLLMASNNLGVSAYKQNPEISLCRSRHKKLSLQEASSFVKSLVFEISDDEN